MSTDTSVNLPCLNEDAALACPDLPIEQSDWCVACKAYEALTRNGTTCPPH
jgi:hypothetical protein